MILRALKAALLCSVLLALSVPARAQVIGSGIPSWVPSSLPGAANSLLYNNGGALSALSAFGGDISGGTALSPTVTQITGAARMFIGDQAGGSDAKFQIWAFGGTTYLAPYPYTNTQDENVVLGSANCGAVTIAGNAVFGAPYAISGTFVNVVAPHNCEPASFTGTISGTALTVSGVTGTIKIGQNIVSGGGVTAGTFIVSGSGTSWVVNNSQSVGPEAMVSGGATQSVLNLRPAGSNTTELFQFTCGTAGNPAAYPCEFESGAQLDWPATIGNVGTAQPTGSNGEMAFTKISDPNTAPSAGFLKLTVEAGTSGGTCKLVARAGTSTTPVTVVDNVGSGC